MSFLLVKVYTLVSRDEILSILDVPSFSSIDKSRLLSGLAGEAYEDWVIREVKKNPFSGREDSGFERIISG